MKKYLMMGMAAVVFSTAFVSCSSEDGIEQKTQIQLNKENYELAFVRNFGTPSPTHTWGFGAKTRSAYPNGNMWEDEGYKTPAPITDAERAKVLAVFNQKGAESYTSSIDWNTFFVQQVYKGVATYTAGNGDLLVGSDHMDYLVTVATIKEVVTNWWPKESEIVSCDPYDDHMFDFNGSNSNDYGGCMLMVNSNTNEFGYFSSTDSQMHYYFRLEEIDGNYYVGFDFAGEGANPNQQVERDCIYNDWIVKIVPGEGDSSVEYEDRIMCEDLGTVDDFDFNDVVFDVRYENGDAYVKLVHIGGTLPLYIEGTEVHEYMGQTEPNAAGLYSIMGNVRNSSKEFKVEGATQASDITIKVDGSILTAKGDNVTQNDNAELIELEAIQGKVPQKICVSPTVEPAAERERIDQRYAKFPEWVADENTDFE